MTTIQIQVLAHGKDATGARYEKRHNIDIPLHGTVKEVLEALHSCRQELEQRYQARRFSVSITTVATQFKA